MIKKQAATPEANLLGPWLSGYSPEAMFDAQQRGLRTLTQASQFIADANQQMLQIQLNWMKSLGSLAAELPKSSTDKADITASMHSQFETAKKTLESAVHSARDVNDTWRDCCMKVAQEFEEYTEQNLKAWKTQMEEADAGSSAADQQVPRVVSA